MVLSKSTTVIKSAAKDLAGTITDRVEDQLQNEKERYIRYKASLQTG